MQWKVYVLLSGRIRRTYVGCSQDVVNRLRQHNLGKVKATKYGVPWRLIYEEYCNDYKEARRRERYYKSGAGRKKIFHILKERCESG